ncbi:DUF4251 domain-containing protein [Polaribacter litorisediminis]|uniref:DUF4251 domain-containing protein n=1 Tax=Polaribacter litorisediminis TaxID=1908341 RepID=UPI001CBCD3BC|nr:DUF4251 domain-containing protein [Polaribacter litorisediminis]UAM99352.1 DUF4251 domain-containing protein [Polaribacter litorisediminis]
MFLKFRFLLLSLLIVNIYSCKSTAALAEIESMRKTVLDKNFTIVANSASPVAFANVRGIEKLLPPGSNLANISLINIQNNFTIKNDSVFLDMPFYGERRFANGYGTETGLQFKGKPDRVKTSFNAKKNKYLLEYWLNAKTESLRISLTLFANKTCRFTVNSSHRSTITYDGNWESLKN